MSTIIELVLAVAAGFVAGVLVGRKNKTLVETAVTEGKVVEAKVESLVAKK
jgi:hypothetical protein